MNAPPSHRSCSGFTLVEVLVAVLVLSVGLLGVAALQTTSLRLNTDAFNLTQAQLLIDDLTERMRSNWNDGDALARYESQFAAASVDDCDVSSVGQADDDLTGELSCWLEQVDRTIGLQFTPTMTLFAADVAKARFADIQLGWRDRELSTEDECDDFQGRVWQSPAAPAGATAPPEQCFVVVTWSVSL